MTTFDDPSLVALNHPLDSPLHFLGLELVVFACFALTLRHAIASYRRGEPSHLLLWLGILVYGLVMEMVAFHYYQNYDHAQFTVQLYHRKLPLYVTFVYLVFHYTGIQLALRLGAGRLATALIAGLSICMLDVPFDTLGVDAGWWTWSASDPILAERWLGVPITSYYWYMAFGAVLTAIAGALRPLADRGPFAIAGGAIAIAAGTFVGGVIAFLPFHALVAVGVPADAIVAAHMAGCAALAVRATRRRAGLPPGAITAIPVALHGFFLALWTVLWVRGDMSQAGAKLAVMAAAAAISLGVAFLGRPRAHSR